MATKKKMLMSSAGAGGAGGAGLDITEVFSTYLYTGNGSTQTITNDIDLAGEGGLTWIKNRGPNAAQNALYDTERGVRNILMSNLSNAQISATAGSGLTAFNSNGFTLGTSWFDENNNGQDVASWTFRKAPKFFDVVTYTGVDAPQTISHNLGVVPGCIIVKRTDMTGDWAVYHRGVDATAPENYWLKLNNTDAREDYDMWFDTAPTDTQFSVRLNSTVNEGGGTYVAYLFAHNDGDGEFGPDGDADIIKCGSYTSSNPTNRPEVDLGFEPQWLLIKNATASSNWMLVDNMRGLPVNGGDQTLAADSNAAENGIIGEPNAVALTPTGFKLTGGVTASNASTGNTHIYIAIRRGPLAQPESGTEVFDVAERGQDSPPPAYRSGFVTDMFINRADVTLGGNNFLLDRLRGNIQVLLTEGTDAEAAYGGSAYAFDQMEGVGSSTNSDVNNYSWMWKRAPGFFDVVAYTGNGTNPHNINHNLGVAPEMMWVKRRDSTGQWEVYYDTGNPSTNNGLGLLRLNSTGTDLNGTFVWGNTHPTDSVFTVGSNGTNQSGANFIAYLFATLPGVSKVGSYTGNSSASVDVDCGFTSGARFVLIKNATSTGDWWVIDTVRGLTSSNDGLIRLNSTAAEVSSVSRIDPYSSGFTVTNSDDPEFNRTGNTYIFYAIA